MHEIKSAESQKNNWQFLLVLRIKGEELCSIAEWKCLRYAAWLNTLSHRRWKCFDIKRCCQGLKLNRICCESKWTSKQTANKKRGSEICLWIAIVIKVIIHCKLRVSHLAGEKTNNLFWRVYGSLSLTSFKRHNWPHAKCHRRNSIIFRCRLPMPFSVGQKSWLLRPLNLLLFLVIPFVLGHLCIWKVVAMP